MQPKIVQELMWSQHTALVSVTLTVREAAERLIVSDTDLLAVRDSQGRLAGIVTESSVVRCLLANPPAGATIEPLLIGHVECVRHDESVSSVLHLFRSACHTAVPVVDQHQRVCGLLLRRDILSEMLNTAIRVPPAAAIPAATADAAPRPALTRPQPQRAPATEPSLPRLSPTTRIDQAEDSLNQPASAGATAPVRDDAVNATGPGQGAQQRPHFLTGDEARRKLSSVDQIQGGICDPPW